MADPFIASPVDFGPAASFVAPPVVFGTHEAHAGKSGCGAGPGGFQPGNVCARGGHAGKRPGHAERRRARAEHHAAIVAKHPFLEGKAIGSLTTADLTTEQVHAIDRTAHVVHERSTATARGPLVSVVKMNPFHGILADERRFYEVHTLGGDLQDSRSHNDQGKAIAAADRWHKRTVKEIARDARRGGAKFGATVAGPAVAFAAKGGGKGKLSGGHWITVDTASGFRHLYIEGKAGSKGGRVLAGGGATPDNPKSLAEVTGHAGDTTSGGEHLDHARLAAIKKEVAGIGSEHGERGEFHHGPPKDGKEARMLDKAEAKGRHLVYSTIVPETAEHHSGESIHHDLGGRPFAVTMPNPEGKGWVSRQFSPSARGGHDDVPHASRDAALKDSRGAVAAHVEYVAHTNSQYHTPKRLDKFFDDERTGGRLPAAEGRAINVYRLIHRDKVAGAAFGAETVATPPVEVGSSVTMPPIGMGDDR